MQALPSSFHPLSPHTPIFWNYQKLKSFQKPRSRWMSSQQSWYRVHGLVSLPSQSNRQVSVSCKHFINYSFDKIHVWGCFLLSVSEVFHICDGILNTEGNYGILFQLCWKYVPALIGGRRIWKKYLSYVDLLHYSLFPQMKLIFIGFGVNYKLFSACQTVTM